jgi:serine/threonine protein kinase/tetratricopeptide (TPR) repeat protein
MGIVYRAFDYLLGREVALKRLLSTDTVTASDGSTVGPHTTDVRATLAQEFKLLASLRHPNIISVLDFGFDAQGLPYISMELAENARNFIEYGTDQLHHVQVNMIAQLLQALVYLHRRGVLHRDLKPSNILVPQGLVKVLDFGLSTQKEEIKPSQTIAGTIAYMAPELLSGNPPSEASDLYAVGLMSYELFAGQHPFNMTNVSTLIFDILKTVPNIDQLTITPQLQQMIARLLSKNPADRYTSAYEVSQELRLSSAALISQPLLNSDSFLQAAQFVGRTAELNQLQKHLDAVLERQGNLCLIGGVSGVGKSRLVEELRMRALIKGVVVVSGQSSSESNIPYQVWRDVLRWLLLLVDVSPMEASILKPLVADIETLLQTPVEDAPAIDARGVPERLFGVISGMVSRLDRPMMIVLEDLQWAGSESLNLLARLLPLLATTPLLLVGTYREDEAQQLPAQFNGATLIKLKSLSPKEISQLSQSMLGEVGAKAEVLDVLQRESEGNVFFLVEVVRALAEEAGELDAVGLSTLPSTVFAGGIQKIVSSRLNRVPAEYKPLVTLAAVSGRGLSLDLLKHLLPQLDVDQAIMTCAEMALFEVFDNQWRFSHDKLREGAVALLTDGERRTAHQQVAQGLATLYPNTPDQAPRLAYHWGQAGDAAQAATYSAIAAEHLLQNGAYQEATAHAESALAFLQQQPETPELLQKTLAVQLNHATLKLVTAGQGAPETKGSYDRARDIANRMGETPQMFQVLFGLWAFYLFSGNLTTAREVSQQCLAMAQKFNISGMIMESHVTLSNTEFWLGNLVEAKHNLEQVIRLYNPAEHDAHLHMFGQDARITARTCGTWATWVLGYPAQAQAHAAESLRIATMRDNLFLKVIALQIDAWLKVLNGDVVGALTASDEMVTICQRENFPVYLALGLMLRGWSLSKDGQLEEGIALLQQGKQLWQVLGSQLITAFCAWLSEALLMADDWQAALQEAEQGIADAHLHSENVFLSELLRVKGQAQLKLGHTSQGQATLLQAYQAAERIHAKSFQLRCALVLYQAFPTDEHRARLHTDYVWFSEGHDTHDLQQARQVLGR